MKLWKRPNVNGQAAPSLNLKYSRYTEWYPCSLRKTTVDSGAHHIQPSLDRGGGCCARKHVVRRSTAAACPTPTRCAPHRTTPSSRAMLSSASRPSSGTRRHPFLVNAATTSPHQFHRDATRRRAACRTASALTSCRISDTLTDPHAPYAHSSPTSTPGMTPLVVRTYKKGSELN